MTSLSALTIKEALTRLKTGLLTAQDLSSKFQQRIKATQLLNMYVTTVPESAWQAQARESQKRIDEGKGRALEAIPIGFKDNFCTQGIPTTCASEMLRCYVPPYNATMVDKCLTEGAIISGKLNLDEFAMGSSSLDSCHGPVVNPWSLVIEADAHDDPQQNTVDCKPTEKKANGYDGQGDFFIAGGSSGGSAAAVASGTCLAAFGSDTGGSVRIPAGYCGLVGLKPSYGLLSRHGLIPLVNSLDCPGLFTKTVEDCALLLNAVAGHDVRDSTTLEGSPTPCHLDMNMDLSGLHVGIPKELYVSALSEEMLATWQDVADVFANAGARVSQVSLPHSQLSIYCYNVLSYCEVASNFSRYDGIEFGLRKGSEESTEELFSACRHLGFNEEVRGRILFGNYFLLESNYDKYFVQAQKVRRLIHNDIKTVYDSGVDLLLTPITLTDALPQSWYHLEEHASRREELDIFSVLANLAGVPAISVPIRLSRKGLPLSLQLVGPVLGESKLLSTAHWLEQTANCPRLSLDFLDDRNKDHTL